DSMLSPQEGLSAKDESILRLSHLPCENQDQKARQSVLLGELADLMERIEALTNEVHDQRFARLTAEHKQVRKAGRIAETALQKASEEFVSKDVFSLNMIELQRETRQKLQDLHDLEKRGEHLKRFHSDQELAEWKRNYSEHQDLVAASNQMAMDAVNERAAAQQALETAREEVNRLAGIESRIRSELRGLPHWDPATGLGEPGAGRMTPEIAAMMGPHPHFDAEH
ncbi:MAG: hypothetical protein WA581_10265, partial [Candidatus Acidiferrales bacterium]